MQRMENLTILQYPDPRLYTVAKPVARVDDRVRALIAAMFDVMYKSNGVGLAATQVDVHECIFVMDTSEERNRPLALLNPEILRRSDECKEWEEGCLSVPGIYDKVVRPATVRVRALDAHGEPFEMDAEGLDAVCIQHEMDHLLGKMFVDYLSPLKRNRIKTKMLKRQRQAA